MSVFIYGLFERKGPKNRLFGQGYKYINPKKEHFWLVIKTTRYVNVQKRAKMYMLCYNVTSGSAGKDNKHVLII